MSCTVTFDTQVFQHVVWPHRFPNDPEASALSEIHKALTTGRVQGFIADPLANIEQIQKKKRPAYFGGMRAIVAGSEVILPDGRIKVSYTVKPDPSAHPSLPPILIDCIKDALKIGFKILRCPRIGLPSAPELQNDWYVIDKDENEQRERQQRFFSTLREIEGRGVGMAILKQIGAQLLTDNGETGPWCVGLTLTNDQQEKSEIAKAGAEWADGDTIAAHIAYQNRLFCTRDKAVSAGKSIFDPANRAWLEKTYGVRFVTPGQLAAKLSK